MLALSDDIRGTYMEILEATLPEAQAFAKQKALNSTILLKRRDRVVNYMVYSENS